MIAEPRARAPVERSAAPAQICPACRRHLRPTPEGSGCVGCGRSFPTIEGIPDLRIAPDRYLSLEDDRAKAHRLAAIAPTVDFAGLARAYYAMTEDVDPSRAERFVSHLENAESRSQAFAELLPPGGRILEVGCGSGAMLKAAADRGRRIEGVDIALRWLVVANSRVKTTKPIAANAEHLPWPDETFDTIFADSLIEHLDDPATALHEFRRVAKRNAKLILISPNRHSLGVDPHIGLWGIGLLPRSWQTPYVRLRRRTAWPIQLRSPIEIARLAKAAGWRIDRLEAAPYPDSRPETNRARNLYERLRAHPLPAKLLRTFGPLWLLQAIAEESR